MDFDEWPDKGQARMVHKYAVPINDLVRELMMPWPSKIVHVGVQPNVADYVMIWAEVERAAASSQLRRFIVRGTGHYIPPDAEWRGTVQDPPFVWHLYEIPDRDNE